MNAELRRLRENAREIANFLPPSVLEHAISEAVETEGVDVRSNAGLQVSAVMLGFADVLFATHKSCTEVAHLYRWLEIHHTAA